MNTETENNALVITATGDDKIGIVEQMTGRIADSGCNIEESRMAVLGGKFALILLVSGAWHALSKLEAQLTALGQQPGLSLIHERTSQRGRAQPAIPYSVEVIAIDHPGIVRSLAAFFAKSGISIEALQSGTYPAPHTGTLLTSVLMTVGIPAKVHIPTLRGDFLDYCDDLNLDATLEPVRG